MKTEKKVLFILKKRQSSHTGYASVSSGLLNSARFVSDMLNKNGIETRPILSGNFVNQSSIKLYKINYNLKTLKNSQEIEERGFFIGLPTQIISLKKLKNLTLSLLNIDKI